MSAQTHRAFVTLLSFMRKNALAVHPGATVDEINAIQRRLSIAIPQPLTDLLKVCGGVDPEEILRVGPTRHIRLWRPVEFRVGLSAEVGSWAPAMLFADYMLHSAEFAVPTGSQNVIVANGADSFEVASSIDEFIAGYIQDDPRVFGSGR